MYFIKDINYLAKNSYESLNDFIDPISLKERLRSNEINTFKLFELRNSSKGVEKTIEHTYQGLVKILYIVDVYLRYLKIKKNLKFYNFNYVYPNIDFSKL